MLLNLCKSYFFPKKHFFTLSENHQQTLSVNKPANNSLKLPYHYHIMSTSRKTNLTLILTLFGIILLGACGNDVNDELPQEILTFINKYYPNSAVSSFDEAKNGSYTVTIRNGAILKFDSQMKWTEINGNGVTLPPMMIMDESPAPLFRYIKEMERTNEVYLLSRNSEIYRVEFLDTYITYTIATGTISYPK